jgi:tetratricopeptide (TPR) repeat protein
MRQYEVASKMESLWSRPPLVRNNPLATPHFTSQIMAIESTCNDIEKKSIYTWKKDWEQKGVQGDLCLFTADAYFEAGLIPYARPFYRSAWGQLPDYSLSKMLVEFKLLLCSDLMNKELNPREKETARRVLEEAKIIEQYSLTPAQLGDFYRVCGGLHMLLKENQNAMTDFEKAYPLLAGKNRQQLSVSLAQTYLALGQKNKAIDLLQKERNTTSWRGPEQLLNSILSPIPPLSKKNLDTAP